MEREIKFRALAEDGQVVYGNLIRRENATLIGYYMITNPTMQDPCGDTVYYEAHVIPDTVCEFTGLKDKNQKEIYEMDILDGNFVVTWKHIMAMWDLPRRQDESLLECEVIGNMHETPELLK